VACHQNNFLLTPCSFGGADFTLARQDAWQKLPSWQQLWSEWLFGHLLVCDDVRRSTITRVYVLLPKAMKRRGTGENAGADGPSPATNARRQFGMPAR
jgi:hypothetical protein